MTCRLCLVDQIFKLHYNCSDWKFLVISLPGGRCLQILRIFSRSRLSTSQASLLLLDLSWKIPHTRVTNPCVVRTRPVYIPQPNVEHHDL